jgi:hypothetical protein
MHVFMFGLPASLKTAANEKYDGLAKDMLGSLFSRP